jgi:hypothetical protein
MKEPLKVQAPEGCDSYLTAGKIYDVVGYWEKLNRAQGHGFNIIDDEGYEISCREKNCAHIDGKNWIIIETES